MDRREFVSKSFKSMILCAMAPAIIPIERIMPVRTIEMRNFVGNMPQIWSEIITRENLINAKGILTRYKVPKPYIAYLHPHMDSKELRNIPGIEIVSTGFLYV